MDVSSTSIVILLTDVANGDGVAEIEFNPRGILVFRVVSKGLNVFALKPVERILKESGFSEPLRKKYAKLLEGREELPADILEHEANFYAGVLNSRNPPLTIAGRSVKAEVVRYSGEDSG
jgi:hypothetical protein